MSKPFERSLRVADDNSRTTKLKVVGGNWGGRFRAILACRSIAEFVRATRISREYACETGNREEIEKAMSAPGTLFLKPYSGSYAGNEWESHERYDR